MNKRVSIAYFSAVLLVGASRAGEHFQCLAQSAPAPQPQVLVLGFMGGRNKQDNPRFGVGRFANRLRAMDLPCVRVATIENSRRDEALKLVRGVFDRNGDGRIDANERSATRLIVYGQSFGGAAVVKFARQLKGAGIPVLLTVQVDAVGTDDEVIPSNVSAAANLFQRDDAYVHGPSQIRAEDPRATQIVGNFQFSYRNSSIDVSDLPWHKKVFQQSHVRMDRDPAVWGKVEELILVALADNGWCLSSRE